MENENQSFAAIVGTVLTTTREGQPLMKNRADGTQAPYALCTVEITEGVLVGKTVWAQRTLLNRDGVVKSAVEPKQEVRVVLSVVDNKPFFEIQTGTSVTADADTMALLGLGVNSAPVANEA